MIRKVNDQLIPIWTKSINTIGRTSIFKVHLKDNTLYLGGVKDNLNTNRRDFIYRNYLLALDSNGVQQWEWQSPLGELWAGVHDMVLLEDGSIILATMKGEEFPGNSNSGYVVWQKAIVKLDPQRNVEWQKIIDPESKSGYEIITMKQFSDNETAIMNGFHVIPYIGLNGYVRAIDQVNLMTKFSVTTGDIIWQRKLSYLDGGDKRHQIYDTEQTPDGGYIMVGESRDGSFPPNPPYPQQGWIIKVDSMGCLVPGCHTAVVEPSLGAATLKLFPNPATDYLNILLQVPAQHKDGQFRVIDLMGRVIATFPVSFQEGTAVLPVYDYVPGMYWLQYVEGAEVKVTKSFVVH